LLTAKNKRDDLMNNEELTSELTELPDAVAMSEAYPELEKLKAANETLRQQGKEWLLTMLETICDEINLTLAPSSPVESSAPATLQIGRQDWQFEVEKNVMVGERLGIRYRGQTLLIEAGWPRQPEHGIVPDLGLARARVSLSQNVMIEAKLLDDLTLRRTEEGNGVVWYVLTDHRVGERVTEEKLRAYVRGLTTPEVNLR
jgi:hypothetical protein